MTMDNLIILILGTSRGTSVNANTVVQDDDNVGEVLFVELMIVIKLHKLLSTGNPSS